MCGRRGGWCVGGGVGGRGGCGCPRTCHFLPPCAHTSSPAPSPAAVDTSGAAVEGSSNPTIRGDSLVLFHYAIKSEQEYREKMARGEAFFWSVNVCCDVVCVCVCVCV